MRQQYLGMQATLQHCHRRLWIARYGAAYGNVEEPVYDWKFATLGEMAEAVEAGGWGS